MSILINNALINGVQRDVWIVGDRIREIAPRLIGIQAEFVIDADGRPAIPGLHDHHLHLYAMAAAASSIKVGPPEVTNERGFYEALRSVSKEDGTTWIRAIGYHESVAGKLDRHLLDRAVSDRPVRVQHRSGTLWIFNSMGFKELKLNELGDPGVERDGAGVPTGRLFHLDKMLRSRLPKWDISLGPTSSFLASRGVTGVTDATVGTTSSDAASLVKHMESGDLLQRLHLMLPATEILPDSPLISRGPQKIIIHDQTLPSIDELSDEVAHSHHLGVPVAIHCVTAVQLIIAIEALRQVGTHHGDRIEHASIVPAELIEALKKLRVTVVTNPTFISERGDEYLLDVRPDDLNDLYRCASLLRAGVPIAGSTDAPFASADPWHAIRAAISRRTVSGRMIGNDEAIDATTALNLFMGKADAPSIPRRIDIPGQIADICILEEGLEEIAVRDIQVTATIVAGQIVYPVCS